MLVVFAYEVDPALRERFEEAYGPDGVWAAVFRGADGYLGTELHRSREAAARYLVLDRWASAEAYERFLERHREEYDRLSRETEALYVRETLLGRFEALAPAAAVTLELLPGAYAACRLDPGAPTPPWAQGGGLCSVTRTPDELSVVCREDAVPAGVEAERGWRALRVAGPLHFGLTGIAAALTAPLAAVAVPLLLVATYDTDYVLVREHHLERSLAALQAAGHRLADG